MGAFLFSLLGVPTCRTTTRQNNRGREPLKYSLLQQDPWDHHACIIALGGYDCSGYLKAQMGPLRSRQRGSTLSWLVHTGDVTSASFWKREAFAGSASIHPIAASSGILGCTSQ